MEHQSMTDAPNSIDSSDATGPTSTIVVQRLLDLLAGGDPDASRQLLDVSIDRLRQLSRKIMADIPGVSRWEDTDDLLQNGAIRLWKSLESHHPPTPLDYFRLAAAVIRRELIDLSRHYFGPHGMGANLARSWGTVGDRPVPQVESSPDETYDPQRLGRWTEFHEYVEKLPDEDRALFDLLWYQGLTLGEAAQLLGAAERTTRRRWKTVRVNLYRDLLDDSTEV
jgi:RNA polymerase sigma factor (sigma-70 family)